MPTPHRLYGPRPGHQNANFGLAIASFVYDTYKHHQQCIVHLVRDPLARTLLSLAQVKIVRVYVIVHVNSAMSDRVAYVATKTRISILSTDLR